MIGDNWTILRWFVSGLVVYVSLVVVLRWNHGSVIRLKDMQDICLAQEVKQSQCSCRQNTPFDDGVRIAKNTGDEHFDGSSSSLKKTSDLTAVKSAQDVSVQGDKWRNLHGSTETSTKTSTSISITTDPTATTAYTRPAGKEQHHIAFVKTHKAASSTVLNILYRFARSRHLVVLLPKSGNYIHGRQLNKTSLMPPPRGRTYDILCNHAIFNHSSFSAFLPTDTQYVGIVREPYQRFLSAFYYFRYVNYEWYLQVIPGRFNMGLKAYLLNPARWEPKDPLKSKTNNRMAIDFGYPPEHFNNATLFDEYLRKLNKTFSIVMVSERFDESLVLMKRLFNWTMKDILYIVKNKSGIRKSPIANDKRLKNNYNKYSHLDRKLYDFFYNRLDSQIRQQGSEFFKEVEGFQIINSRVSSFCTYDRSPRPVTIGATAWTERFTITKQECRFLRLEEIGYLSFVRSQQANANKRYGINDAFIRSLP